MEIPRAGNACGTAYKKGESYMVLKDKVAVVTGASSGMGYVIAAEYAREGATVLAVARRAERLEKLVQETQGYPGKVVAFAADLSDMAQAEKIIDEAVSRFGKIDILVNNAGIMDDFSPVGQFKNEVLDKLMKVNVFAPFYSSRRAIEAFEKQGGGVIINVASVAGLYGGRGGAAYVASKHALVGLTKNTAYYYKEKTSAATPSAPAGLRRKWPPASS
jgi:NAD(P)-dependent dehydrogenase (short-subunit alcohol dehydrogenase family)